MNKAPENDNKITEDHVSQVYKWSIETKIGVFTGTCLSIDDVNQEIAQLTKNAKILKKNIMPISSIYENKEDKIYTWNVITKNSEASGITTSLKEAQNALNLFGSAEIIKSNISESFTALK